MYLTQHENNRYKQKLIKYKKIKAGYKKPALNSDLWDELLNLLDTHKVSFNWIKGHAGYLENERCDKLAVSFYKTLQNK